MEQLTVLAHFQNKHLQAQSHHTCTQIRKNRSNINEKKGLSSKCLVIVQLNVAVVQKPGVAMCPTRAFLRQRCTGPRGLYREFTCSSLSPLLVASRVRVQVQILNSNSRVLLSLANGFKPSTLTRLVITLLPCRHSTSVFQSLKREPIFYWQIGNEYRHKTRPE